MAFAGVAFAGVVGLLGPRSVSVRDAVGTLGGEILRAADIDCDWLCFRTLRRPLNWISSPERAALSESTTAESEASTLIFGGASGPLGMVARFCLLRLGAARPGVLGGCRRGGRLGDAALCGVDIRFVCSGVSAGSKIKARVSQAISKVSGGRADSWRLAGGRLDGGGRWYVFVVRVTGYGESCWLKRACHSAWGERRGVV